MRNLQLYIPIMQLYWKKCEIEENEPPHIFMKRDKIEYPNTVMPCFGVNTDIIYFMIIWYTTVVVAVLMILDS